MEKTVKILLRQGNIQYVVSETNIEYFLSRMKVSRVGETCFIAFQTPAGGIELALPQSNAIDIVESLALMLPHEDMQELFARMSEKLT
jgi:hypothetical protein